jgi:hypothetical protein
MSSSSSRKKSYAKGKKRFWCILDADIRARNENEAAKEFLRIYGIRAARVRDVLVDQI